MNFVHNTFSVEEKFEFFLLFHIEKYLKTNQTTWRTIYLSSSDCFFWGETKKTKQNEGKTRDVIVIVYGIGVVYQKGRRVYQHHLKMRC